MRDPARSTVASMSIGSVKRLSSGEKAAKSDKVTLLPVVLTLKGICDSSLPSVFSEAYSRWMSSKRMSLPGRLILMSFTSSALSVRCTSVLRRLSEKPLPSSNDRRLTRMSKSLFFKRGKERSARRFFTAR